MTHEPEAGGFPGRAPGLHVLGRGLQGLLRIVPANCPVCGVREMGGMLCGVCEGAAVRSMRGSVPMAVGARHESGSEPDLVYRCARCALRLRTQQLCPDCTLLPLAVSRVLAAFDYDATGKALVSRFKQGRQFLLSRALARLMTAEVRRHDDRLESVAGHVLVPVPSRRISVRERGFSPAAELARYLARDLGLPCRLGWLARRGDGPRQTGLTRRGRLALADIDAYDCKALPGGARIILVDDVMTTGSTLHQAATALRQAGAVDVMAVVLARTPLGGFPPI